MVRHAVSPECKHPAVLTAPEGHVTIEGDEEEGKLQFFACTAFIKERLWLQWSLRHCVLLSGQTERGDRKKSREQHANQNIPAEILTPELSSLKTTCVEQNLRSGWSSCSKHQFQTISVVKKP